MLILILFLVAGSLLAYISKYNLMPVTVNLGQYIFSGVPLFYVIIGSFIAGLALAYVLSLVPAITSWWALRGKEHEIKNKKNEVLELTKRVHQLELENEKLKHDTKAQPKDINAL